MIFWWITVAILCLAAFGDGYTTQMGIEKGNLIESNKFLDALYGTNLPKAWQTYGIGFGIIGLEVLVGTLLIKHNTFGTAFLWPYGALMQAGFHIYCIFSNYKLDTGKSLL